MSVIGGPTGVKGTKAARPRLTLSVPQHNAPRQFDAGKAGRPRLSLTIPPIAKVEPLVRKFRSDAQHYSSWKPVSRIVPVATYRETTSDQGPPTDASRPLTIRTQLLSGFPFHTSASAGSTPSPRAPTSREMPARLPSETSLSAKNTVKTASTGESTVPPVPQSAATDPGSQSTGIQAPGEFGAGQALLLRSSTAA